MQTATQRPQLTLTAIKLLIGFCITAVGVLLALDNLDLIHSYQYLVWWPVFVVAIGLIMLAFGGSRFFGAILLIVGLWLTAYNLGVIDFTIFDLWPVILIVVGLGFVAAAFGWKPEAPAVSDSTTLAILTTRKIDETARDFTGRRYVAFMGSCEVDLTAADVGPHPAEIETFVLMGGIVITVPDGWEIVGEVVPVMAGFEVTVRPGNAPGKRLIVRGAALMGGIEVKSAPARKS